MSVPAQDRATRSVHRELDKWGLNYDMRDLTVHKIGKMERKGDDERLSWLDTLTVTRRLQPVLHANISQLAVLAAFDTLSLSV